MNSVKHGALSAQAPSDGPATYGPKYSEPTAAQMIRDLLARAQLSQRAAARELGVDERTMRYWCSDDSGGRPAAPRMAILALERLVDMGRMVQEKG